MPTLEEHADNIKAAMQAAIEDGCKIESDIQAVYYSGEVERVEIDVWRDRNYINIFLEERN